MLLEVIKNEAGNFDFYEDPFHCNKVSGGTDLFLRILQSYKYIVSMVEYCMPSLKIDQRFGYRSVTYWKTEGLCVR